MIPILNGIEAGRAHIARARALEDKGLDPKMAERIRNLFGADLTPDQAVARILADVAARGEAACREWTKRIDGVELARLRVSPDEIDAAYQETPVAVREALHRSADRIRAFHDKQKPRSWVDWAPDGSALGQLIQPLARVGVYVPGGTAPLPSSLLMSAIPAQVAGVAEIVVATPPGRDGRVAPVILAAARTAGVDQVLTLGGAQAIAALAYGTENLPRVDKIVGAGGLFTTLAKRQVYGRVGIDGLYGPTETLLIADDSANPAWVAADLLAQAEHDVLATSILITPSQTLADAVKQAIGKQAAALSRRAIVEQSLAGQGAIIVIESLEQALELSNAFAPEHLCLLVREPWEWVPRVRNAGGIFVGEWSSEALGDYVLGPSHVMPTAGTARFGSPLNVNDFCKITSILHVPPALSQSLAQSARILAESEGLTAHANAAIIRGAPDKEQ
ncbi:MAG: histidinol dehydrogenase [Anaerolineae bacterium]